MGSLRDDKIAIAIKITPKTGNDIWLTTVDDTQVSGSSTITDYPIVDGSLVADHMYKEPVTYTISGTWGYNNLDTYKVPKNNSLLSTFQKTFENIKNNGTLCSIVKMTIRDNGPQFLKRTNMILQSFSWTEGVNSLSYTLSFRQMLTAEVGIEALDKTDIYLPEIKEMKLLNFTDTIIDWSVVDAIILDECFQNNIVTKEFLELLAQSGPVITISLGVAVWAVIKSALAILAWKGIIGGAAAATVTAGMSSLFVSSTAVTAAGGTTVLGALSATATALGWIGLAVALAYIAGRAIAAAIEGAKQTEAAFDDYENEAKNREAILKFGTFVGEIHKKLMVLNNMIHVYQVSANEPHQAILPIGDMYYIFNFEKNSTTQQWQISVEDINGTPVTSKYPLATHTMQYNSGTETRVRKNVDLRLERVK